MSGHAPVRLVAAFLAVSAVLLAQPFAASVPALLAFPLVVLATVLLPGAWVARRVAASWPWELRLAFVLLASPAIGGALFTLLRMLLPSATPAARLAIGIVAAVTVFDVWRGRTLAAGRPTAPTLPLALGAVVALALAYLGNHALAWRSDGAFHAGVVQAITHAWPAEDPFLAGLPLRYFWGLHAWAAMVRVLVPGASAWAALAASSVLALGAAMLAVSGLAGALGASSRARVWSAVLLLVGAAPFAWLTLATHALVGETRGLAELEPVLAHGADLALRALDPGFLHPSLVLPLDKFVVVTPFAWGLVGALVIAWLVGEALTRPSRETAVALALALAATTFVHPVAGGLIAISTLVAVIAMMFARRTDVATAGPVLTALAVSGLAFTPYLGLFASSVGGGSPLVFGLEARGVSSVVWGGAVLLPLAWRALRRAASPTGVVVALQLAVLLVPALVLRAGGDNQSKALNLAFALAAAPAAIALTTWTTTRRRTILVTALACLAWGPTLAAVGFAYAHERTTSADAPWTTGPAMERAVEHEVPRTAVLVDATLDARRDAAPHLPGATGRALLWSGAFMAGKWGHPEPALRARETAAAALAEGRWPEGDAGAMLAALGREVWVIVPDDSTHAWAASSARAHEDGAWLVRVDHP